MDQITVVVSCAYIKVLYLVQPESVIILSEHRDNNYQIINDDSNSNTKLSITF